MTNEDHGLESFRALSKIAAEHIQERIQSVQILKNGENDLYEVSKDSVTGEHYLHYAYLHRDLALTGEPEQFHHLLPIESDDVLGIIIGGQPYEYPQYWLQPFLRNGPEVYYVWFDPSYEEERQEHEELGEKIKAKLEQFKRAGTFDEETVRKLFIELDEMKET